MICHYRTLDNGELTIEIQRAEKSDAEESATVLIDGGRLLWELKPYKNGSKIILSFNVQWTQAIYKPDQNDNFLLWIYEVLSGRTQPDETLTLKFTVRDPEGQKIIFTSPSHEMLTVSQGRDRNTINFDGTASTARIPPPLNPANSWLSYQQRILDRDAN